MTNRIPVTAYYQTKEGLAFVTIVSVTGKMALVSINGQQMTIRLSDLQPPFSYSVR